MILHHGHTYPSFQNVYIEESMNKDLTNDKWLDDFLNLPRHYVLKGGRYLTGFVGCTPSFNATTPKGTDTWFGDLDCAKTVAESVQGDVCTLTIFEGEE